MEPDPPDGGGSLKFPSFGGWGVGLLLPRLYLLFFFFFDFSAVKDFLLTGDFLGGSGVFRLIKAGAFCSSAWNARLNCSSFGAFSRGNVADIKDDPGSVPG